MTNEAKPRIWNKVRVVIDLDVCHKEQWCCEKLAKDTIEYLLYNQTEQCTNIGDGQLYIDLYGDDKFPMILKKVQALTKVETFSE